VIGLRQSIERAAAVILVTAAVAAPGHAAAQSGNTAASAADPAHAAAFAARSSPREGPPFIGPHDAPDALILFIDYQCPVCPRAAREMDKLVSEFAGALRVEIRHNPLAMHRDAFDASAAAKAAQRQGKFWEYHDLLLASRRHDRQTLTALAEQAGCEREAFLRDLDDAALRDEIRADMTAAGKAGAQATPGFLINGHAESGWASYEYIKGIVLKHRAASAPASPPRP
jgi:protein-disulfide isomerase